MSKQDEDLKSEQDAIQSEYAKLEHQDRLRAARDEFNVFWRAEKPLRSTVWRAQMNRAELLAWEFFLRGKGLKNG